MGKILLLPDIFCMPASLLGGVWLGYVHCTLCVLCDVGKICLVSVPGMFCTLASLIGGVLVRYMAWTICLPGIQMTFMAGGILFLPPRDGYPYKSFGLAAFIFTNSAYFILNKYR